MDPVKRPAQPHNIPMAFQIALVGLCWCVGLLIALSRSSEGVPSNHSLPAMPGARSWKIGDQILFEGFVNPAHQQRWADSLQLKPIPNTAPLVLPEYDILPNWIVRKGHLRAPFSDEEVRNWWSENASQISQGYVRLFPSGGYVALDLQRDRLIGWLEVTAFEEAFR